MSNTSKNTKVAKVEFDFDNVLNQVEQNKGKVKGKRPSLTGAIYNALDNADGKTLSLAQLKLIVRGYQFSKTSNLEKFKSFNDGKLPADYDAVKSLAQTLAQNESPMLTQFMAISEKINDRCNDAMNKAIIEGADKRTTNIPYAVNDYELTTHIEGANVSLVQR